MVLEGGRRRFASASSVLRVYQWLEWTALQLHSQVLCHSKASGPILLLPLQLPQPACQSQLHTTRHKDRPPPEIHNPELCQFAGPQPSSLPQLARPNPCSTPTALRHHTRQGTREDEPEGASNGASRQSCAFAWGRLWKLSGVSDRQVWCQLWQPMSMLGIYLG